MSELMKQIQSDEFRDALKRMQEALERMDRRELEQTLPQWRAQNRDMLSSSSARSICSSSSGTRSSSMRSRSAPRS